MALSATQFTLLCVIAIVLLARPAHAFGAGNIGSTSKIEGENWRHGDLEDTLLTLVASRAMGGKKFSKLDVKRVYFGNWLRDYSQAVDVGTVKMVSAEAIRILLWILGFMSFGYGTKEFEVTAERLGCYRPEEHIDNPKDYADNQDARNYDRRLRGPVDERRELAIDPELGLKAYIASENLGIDTSASLVRKLFGQSIELGRRYARNKNKADLYEALRLLGTGCHCLEDFSAHSNYTELALIELGERAIFPHVGRNCKVHVRGARSSVYPIVTGTFGGVDFLHSVTGEFDDKVTQSEIQELEGTLQQAQNQGENESVLQDLLSKVPTGIFGGQDEAEKADELKTNAAQQQMQNTQITPREPEEWLQYINEAQKQIYPIIEWHDEIMKGITETIENIPILPDLIEQIQEQVNVFVFSLLAPFVLPIISQIKSELNTGSSTIIQSSVEKQHVVFSDDNSSDPTHSMLSKDHFSNVLNEPAGKIAGQVLRWVVPQLIAAWDDETIDIDRTLNRVIRGVFHHPALRDYGDDGAADGRRLMFAVVQTWWQEKSEPERDGLRDQLSRDGVEEGRNHKPGVHDHGHGSAKKLGMPNVYTANHQGAPGGFGAPSGLSPAIANQATQQISQTVGDAVGGGVMGTLVGGLAGAVGGGLFGGLAAGASDDTQSYDQPGYGNDGSYNQNVSQYGSRPGVGTYEQAQYNQPGERIGGRAEQYPISGQHTSAGGYPPGGYPPGGRHEDRTSYGSGGYDPESRRHGSNTINSYPRREDDENSGYDASSLGGGRNTYGQSEQISGHGAQQSFNRRREDEDDDRPTFGRRHDNDNDERPLQGKHHGLDEQNHQPSHGRRHNDDDDSERRGGYGHPQREETGYGSNEYGGGRQEETYGSTGGYGRTHHPDQYNAGREDFSSGGYGRHERPDEHSAGEGYGGRRRPDDENEMRGGFGRTERSDEYSSGRGYGNNRLQAAENDMPGGFGADDDNDDGNERRHGGHHGGRRRGFNDTNQNEGYGEQYGQQQYGGGRSGGYGY